MLWEKFLADHQNEDEPEEDWPDENELWREWVDLITEEGDGP